MLVPLVHQIVVRYILLRGVLLDPILEVVHDVLVHGNTFLSHIIVTIGNADTEVGDLVMVMMD